jgi:hypothetical protein
MQLFTMSAISQLQFCVLLHVLQQDICTAQVPTYSQFPTGAGLLGSLTSLGINSSTEACALTATLVSYGCSELSGCKLHGHASGHLWQDCSWAR